MMSSLNKRDIHNSQIVFQNVYNNVIISMSVIGSMYMCNVVVLCYNNLLCTGIALKGTETKLGHIISTISTTSKLHKI